MPMSAASPSRWFRFNFWLHRWSSLIATAPFLILCLTGTVLIFHEEIDGALGVVPVSAGAADGARPMAESIARVLDAFPDERVGSTSIDPEHHPGVLLVATVPNVNPDFAAAQLRFADLATGRLIGDKTLGWTLTGVLL